jgi:3-oxoacyl-[acyl-carrier protein] reductase
VTRRALVTGGTGAVGAAVVRVLAGRGVPTTFTWHRSAELAAALAAETGARALPLDLRDPAAVRALVAALPERPDAWVQAATPGGEAGGDEARADAWRIHVDGPLALLDALGGPLDAVWVGALDRGQSAALPVHLAAAHGAVAAAAMAAAHAGAAAGVRVNVVALGLLDAGQGARASEEARAAWRRFSAARREGTPAQAAAVITWLLLEDRAMNGRVLAANGGL